MFRDHKYISPKLALFDVSFNNILLHSYHLNKNGSTCPAYRLASWLPLFSQQRFPNSCHQLSVQYHKHLCKGLILGLALLYGYTSISPYVCIIVVLAIQCLSISVSDVIQKRYIAPYIIVVLLNLHE